MSVNSQNMPNAYGVFLWEFQRKLSMFTAQPQSTIKIKQNRVHISWDILRSISTSLDNNNKIVICNQGEFFHASVNLNLHPYPPQIHKIHPKDIMMMTFHEGPFHITGTACNEASDWLHRLKIECHHDANFVITGAAVGCHITDPLWGDIHLWPVDYPHKRSVI